MCYQILAEFRKTSARGPVRRDFEMLEYLFDAFNKNDAILQANGYTRTSPSLYDVSNITKEYIKQQFEWRALGVGVERAAEASGPDADALWRALSEWVAANCGDE